MRNPRRVLLLTLAVLGMRAVPAEAVDLYIDRTRRVIVVPDECTVPGAALSQNLAYNNGGAPAIGPAGALNLVNVDGEFTMLLSTTRHLLARAHNNASELAWYNFQPGNGNWDHDLDNAKRLVRAYVLMRCGLPVDHGDDNLYALPAPGAARAQFIQFAMGDRHGPDPRNPTGYSLIGNGEREAILMYAADRIKFDLTPTIVGRGQVCDLFVNVDHNSGCARELDSQGGEADIVVSYLYEGLNRVSYTAHEFWMMFLIDNFRPKVFFTIGTDVNHGHTVDRFWMYQGGNYSFESDAAGDNRTYPGVLPDGRRPFRFHQIHLNANNERVFYQHTLQAFIDTYHPRVVLSGSIL